MALSVMPLSRFNSKMVRLKDRPSFCGTYRRVPFQFQNGAIKRRVFFYVLLSRIRFNSKMVRLKDGTHWGIPQTEIEFQFQNGAIKRQLSDEDGGYLEMFQFQNGAIKSRRKSKTIHINYVSIPKWCD